MFTLANFGSGDKYSLEPNGTRSDYFLEQSALMTLSTEQSFNENISQKQQQAIRSHYTLPDLMMDTLMANCGYRDTIEDNNNDNNNDVDNNNDRQQYSDETNLFLMPDDNRLLTNADKLINSNVDICNEQANDHQINDNFIYVTLTDPDRYCTLPNLVKSQNYPSTYNHRVTLMDNIISNHQMNSTTNIQQEAQFIDEKSDMINPISNTIDTIDLAVWKDFYRNNADDNNDR